MKKDNTITQKVAKVKGRAMIHWVGKKPLEVVQSYPAQLCESFGTTKPIETPIFDALDKNWSNLLFHGDNKEILSTLLVNGFRGKIDLIYIDPPFDSGADYVRKMELRGTNKKIGGEDQNIIEQTQYTDIWANDNYLQFMYERLILLRELLSEKGSIYLHCDWHKSHHLRFLLDEVFGDENFQNEIIWHWWDGNDWEIMYYNGIEVKQITDNEEDDLEPSYDGSTVVWHKYVEEGGTDIYYAVKNF